MDPTTLLTGRGLLLAGAIWALVSALKLVMPWWTTSSLGKRLLPLLPLVLGALGALAGVADVSGWASRVCVGLIAGAIASVVFKVGKTTVLGKGVDDEPGAQR